MVGVRLVALASFGLVVLAGCTPSGTVADSGETPLALPDCSASNPDFVPTYWGDDATGEAPVPPADFPQAALGLTGATVGCASIVVYRHPEDNGGPHFYVSLTGDPQAFDDISGLLMLLDYSLVEDANGVPYDHLGPPVEGDDASGAETAADAQDTSWLRTFRFSGDADHDLAARTIQLTLWRTAGDPGDAAGELELEFW